jgi:hypothetical protein
MSDYKTDALLDQRLSPLEPNATVRCMEFYLDGEENPSYSLVERKLTQHKPFRKWRHSLAILGDDGFLYMLHS